LFEIFKFLLQSDKYSRYFTLRPVYTFYYISPISSWNEKCFRQKVHRKSKHTFYIQYLFFEYRVIYEKMWKNIVKTGKPQMTKWRMRIACWIHNTTDTY